MNATCFRCNRPGVRDDQDSGDEGRNHVLEVSKHGKAAERCARSAGDCVSCGLVQLGRSDAARRLWEAAFGGRLGNGQPGWAARSSERVGLAMG